MAHEDPNLLHRLYYPLKRAHLRLLAEIAEEERKAFFRRNPESRKFYGRSFIAAALCQGAALHYLGQGKGVKDLDVHFFYWQNALRKQLSRRVKSTIAEFPSFGSRKVDFIRTVVPVQDPKRKNTDIVEVLQTFLTEQPTTNAFCLAKKAVIGLLPRDIFGTVIWPRS